MNIINLILKESRWIGKYAQQSEDWLEKIVEHRTPSGKVTQVKVKSLPPEERDKYRPKQDKSKEEDLKEKIKQKKEELTQKKPEPDLKEKFKKRREQLETSTKNDYTNANLQTLKKNMSNNLSKYENKKVHIDNITSKSPLTKENVKQYKTLLHENAKNTILKYSSALAPESHRILTEETDRIVEHIERGIKDGSLKTSPDKLDTLIQDNMKGMIHQEIETRRRSLGDHGIRHVISNAKNTNVLLDELEKSGIKTTGADRLAASLTQLNHDMGYTLGRAAIDPTSPSSLHKNQSAQVFDENREQYENVLGKDLTDKMKTWIGTHDDIQFDWKEDSIASSIRFADTMSLFGEDKLPELFLKSGKATKVLTKMKLAGDVRQDLNPYKDELKNIIKNMPDTNNIQKEELTNSIDEISSFSVDDFLARYSGKLKGFSFDSKTGTMNANITQSPEHELIQSLFDVGQKKFSSLNKDLSDQYPNDDKNKKLYKTKSGKSVVQINLLNKDKDPINLTTNNHLKDFYKISIRQDVNRIKHELSVPPQLNTRKAKSVVNKISSNFGEPHKKLMNKVVDVYVEQVKKLGLDKTPSKDWTDHQRSRAKRLSSMLVSFPLTDNEKKWLSTKVSYKLAAIDKAIKQQLLKAKNLVHKLESTIKKSGGIVHVQYMDDRKVSLEDEPDYYLVAILKVENVDWLPIEKLTLSVDEHGSINLRMGDREMEIGYLSYVGHWSADSFKNRNIAEQFNKG